MGLSLSVPSTPGVSRATATVVKSHRLYNYDPFLIHFALIILWQQNISISNLQHPTDTAPLWVRPFPTRSTNQAARPCPADRVLPHPHGTQNASLSGQHPYPMGCWVRPSLCGQPSVTECLLHLSPISRLCQCGQGRIAFPLACGLPAPWFLLAPLRHSAALWPPGHGAGTPPSAGHGRHSPCRAQGTRGTQETTP